MTKRPDISETIPFFVSVLGIVSVISTALFFAIDIPAVRGACGPLGVLLATAFALVPFTIWTWRVYKLLRG